MVTRADKAFVAAVAAGGAAFTAALQDGSLSEADIALVVGSALVAFVVTFVVPNKDAAQAAPKA